VTYEPGWLKRRVSEAAREYRSWSPNLQDSMRLTETQHDAPVQEPQERRAEVRG
jgi:hypothetical protein